MLERECNVLQNQTPHPHRDQVEREEEKENNSNEYERAKVTLVMCGNCGKNFKDSAFQKHTRMCK